MTTHVIAWLRDWTKTNASGRWHASPTTCSRDPRAAGERDRPAQRPGLGEAVTLVALWTVVVGSSSVPASVGAAGPWHGRIVDVETQAPIKGVVVLGFWQRWRSGNPPHPLDIGPFGYWASDEVATDADGRFVLPSRTLFDPGVSTHISGPELVIFKAGYGGWRFTPGGAHPMLLSTGAIIEMEPLHSREERVAYQAGMRNLDDRRAMEVKTWRRGWLHDELPRLKFNVPKERRSRYDAAINAERAYLGLRLMKPFPPC